MPRLSMDNFQRRGGGGQRNEKGEKGERSECERCFHLSEERFDFTFSPPPPTGKYEKTPSVAFSALSTGTYQMASLNHNYEVA